MDFANNENPGKRSYQLRHSMVSSNSILAMDNTMRFYPAETSDLIAAQRKVSQEVPERLNVPQKQKQGILKDRHRYVLYLF